MRDHNRRGADPLDFLCVGDTPGLPLGAEDPEILAWAELHERVLVSNDRATLALYLSDHLAAGRHSPGIFLVPRTVLVKGLVDLLAVYSYASEPDEWRDRIAFLA